MRIFFLIGMCGVIHCIAQEYVTINIRPSHDIILRINDRDVVSHVKQKLCDELSIPIHHKALCVAAPLFCGLLHHIIQLPDDGEVNFLMHKYNTNYFLLITR